MRRVRAAAIAAAIGLGTLLPATSASAWVCDGTVNQVACTAANAVCQFKYVECPR